MVNIIYEEDSVVFVDVKYVLGGEEHKIEVEFVKEHNFDDDKTARRKRSVPAPALQEELLVSVLMKNKPNKKKKQPLKDSTSVSNQGDVIEKIIKKQVSKPMASDFEMIVGNEKRIVPLSQNTCSSKAKSGTANYLKSVYTDMTNKASQFVKQVVGASKSEPSSPESSCSLLDVKIQDE